MMDAEQERKWAIACHLSSLIWIPLSMVGLAIPFTNLIAPAIIWFWKKDESELIDAHGKESLNFQISMTLYGIAAGIMLMLLLFIGIVVIFGMGAVENNPLGVLAAVMTGFGFLGAVLLVVAIAIFQLVVVIFAALKAQQGEMYRYPFNLRLL